MNVDRPRLLVIGGPNGAGKPTLARACAVEFGLPYLGADDIASGLSPDNPAGARVEAGREFSRRLSDCLGQRHRADTWIVLSNGEGGFETVALGERHALPVLYNDALWSQLTGYGTAEDVHVES